jgi:hypothetical protein
MLLQRADDSDFENFSSFESLDITVILIAFVDELGDLLEVFTLDRNDLLTHKPLDSFVAVWGSQGALIMESVHGGGECDGELLLHVLSCVEIPGIEGIRVNAMSGLE